MRMIVRRKKEEATKSLMLCHKQGTDEIKIILHE